MTMTELPNKEKVTISQKRAAQRANGNSQGNQASSKSYILTSILPSAFRSPLILHPPKVPSVGAESGYIGLYSFIVSVIYLSEGSRISEGKLERNLKRCNADNYVLNGEKTENVLKKMERQGYIVKIKDREPGGEEIIDWVVGPRGKIEIGEKGVAAMVKNVYGKRDVELDDLENKLEKSLGVGTFRRKTKPRDNEPSGEEDEDGEGEGNEEGQAQQDRPPSIETYEDGTSRARRGERPNGRIRRRNGVPHPPKNQRSARPSSNLVDDEAEDEDDESDDDLDEDEDDD